MVKINPKMIDKTDFIKNSNNNSTTDTYSCNYVNKIGTVVNLFANVCSAESDTGVLDTYSHITATKISSTTWKFDIEGQMDISNAQHNYNWGIRPSRISTALNTAIGVQVGYDNSLIDLGGWEVINPTTKLTYVDRYGYGTTFGYVSNKYITLARYYTTTGSVGGWALDNFANGSIFKATIYLREV